MIKDWQRLMRRIKNYDKLIKYYNPNNKDNIN